MASLFERFARRPPARHHAGAYLPGKSPLRREIELRLSPDEADALHEALEELLENGHATPALERACRLLGWRILAMRGGTGLTGRMSRLAREANTVEEYEAARDEALGPILEGLERGDNRDP